MRSVIQNTIGLEVPENLLGACFGQVAAGRAFSECLAEGLEIVCRALGAASGKVWLASEQTAFPALGAQWPPAPAGGARALPSSAAEAALVSLVSRTGEAIAAPDALVDRQYPFLRLHAADAGFRALEAVPVRFAARQLGAIVLTFASVREPTGAISRPLTTLADLAAVCLQAADHASACGDRGRKLARASQQATIYSQKGSLDEILPAALFDLCRLFEAGSGAIWTWHELDGAFHLEASYVQPDVARPDVFRTLRELEDLGIVADCYQRAELLRVACDRTPSRFRSLVPYLRRVGCSDLLVLPLRFNSAVHGVLTLLFPSPRQLSDRDQRALELILGQVAGAIAVTAQAEALVQENALRRRAERDLRQSLETLRAQAAELGIQRDELARARETERAHIARLEELDRLKASFLNAASHELRTPLTSITGYAEFLEDGLGGELQPQQRAFVHEIQEGAERMRRIVDDMLDFARLEAGTFQIDRVEADMRPIVAGVVSSLQPQARAAGVSVTYTLPAMPVRLSIDAKRIEQVLLNLVSNSIKFTNSGGRVEIAIGHKGSAVEVAVRDTGIGLAASLRTRVFEKFFQADASLTREKGGAGLGLAISKAIVESHGGKIGVRSRPRRGSTFWFTLPAMI